MTLQEILAELEGLGSEKMREHNIKYGAGDNQYGVRMGEIRKVAKQIKANHELGLELWNTGNIDAMFLSILVLKPKSISTNDLDSMIKSITFVHVADWFNGYIVKKHPEKEAMRQKWMESTDPMAARGGWNLTSHLAAKNADILDVPALLDRLEAEMGTAHPTAQWTMNFTLVEIGINWPEYRERVLEIGEKLGVYSDFPVSKGCTSPFAPLWINEMVSRQK